MPDYAFQNKRGTNAKVTQYTGKQGELVMDITNNRLFLHDGKTKGGIQLPKTSDVPTKISQLTNDVNFSQLNTVTATVDSGTGTPTASVTVTGSGNNKGLAFTFTNLKGVNGVAGAKGEKGDKGDKGDTGPQGPRGAQGPAGSSLQQIGAKTFSDGASSYGSTFYVSASRDAYGRLTGISCSGTNCNCNYQCDCSDSDTDGSF